MHSGSDIVAAVLADADVRRVSRLHSSEPFSQKNDAKLRAMANRADFDTFQGMVTAAHLQSVEIFDE